MRDDYEYIKIGDTVKAMFFEDGIVAHRDIIIRGYDEKKHCYYGEEEGTILQQGEEYPYDVDSDNFCFIVDGWLRQSNGKPWVTDDNRNVPRRCPICDADMGLFMRGEPVFLCKGAEEHYYGTLKFKE